MGKLPALVGHLKAKVASEVSEGELDAVPPRHRLWLQKRGQQNKMAAAVPWIVGPLFSTEGGRGDMSSIFVISTEYI